MQDLTSVTGSQVIVRIKGKECRLSGFTLEDWGLFQGEILRRKRDRVIEATAVAAKHLPPDRADAMLERAAEKAAKITTITGEEFDEFFRSDVGVLTFFWILIDRQYPQQFSRADIAETIAEDAEFAKKSETLLDSLLKLSQRGNLPSQVTGAAQPA